MSGEGAGKGANAGDAEVVLRPQYDRQSVLEAIALVQPALAGHFWGETGARARAQVEETRRLPRELLEAHGIGYVPPGDGVVLDVAHREGIPLDLCVEAGLLRVAHWRVRESYRARYGRAAPSDETLSAHFDDVMRDDPRAYTHWPVLPVPEEGGRTRYEAGEWLTIPIAVPAEEGDAPYAIGGFQYRSLRAASEIGKGGRYRSPMNTAALQWSETLIGFEEERGRIARSGRVIVVEGKFDQLGVIAGLEAEGGAGAQGRPGVVGLGGLVVRERDDDDERGELRAGVLGRLPEAGAREAMLFVDGEPEEKRRARTARGGGDELSPEVQAIFTIAPILGRLGLRVSVGRVADGWRRDGSDAAIPKDPGELWARAGAEGIRDAVRRGTAREFPAFAGEEVRAELEAGRLGGQLARRLRMLDLLAESLEPWVEGGQAEGVGRMAGEVTGLPRTAARVLTAKGGPPRERETHGGARAPGRTADERGTARGVARD